MCMASTITIRPPHSPMEIMHQMNKRFKGRFSIFVSDECKRTTLRLYILGTYKQIKNNMLSNDFMECTFKLKL